MAKNRLFFPQAALDEWVIEGRVDIAANVMTITSEGRKYRLIEAAHITTEVTGEEDGHELVARVKSLVYLGELGAEILDNSMILGDNAYDIVPGFLATPIGSFKEHMQSAEGESRRQSAPESQPPANDEDILGQFLMQTL